MATTTLPLTLTSRPMRPEDAAAWAELLQAVEEADRRDEHYDTDDCAVELADPELELERDTSFVVDADGVPVAYQVLQTRSGAGLGTRVMSDAAVHPAYRRRGIGRALLAVACRRAVAEGGCVEIRVVETERGAIAFAESSGMAPVRWWSVLTRDLAEPVTPVALPAHLTLVPLAGPDGRYDAERWDEPLRVAHNAAFADHWGSTPVSEAGWGRRTSRGFRPSASALALAADGTVAGYVMSYESGADTARTGVRDLYIGTVGTVRGHRGQGVAAALLAHVLRAGAGLGYATSSLAVDAQNPTGALGVYERAGYRLRRRTITYQLPAANVAARAAT